VAEPEAAAAGDQGSVVPAGRGWLDAAESAWLSARAEEATAAWQAFEREVPEGEWTTLDRARVLDGRGLVAQDQPEVALEAWRQALALYAELGEEVRVLRDRGRIGRMLCAQGEIEEGLATGEEPLRWLIDNDEPHRRGGWQDSLATMYAQAGRYDDAVRELTELQARTDIDNELRASGSILRCNLLGQMGRLEEAEEAATIGLGTAYDLPRSFAYRQRGRIRLGLERPVEAAEDLTEAVALAAGVAGLEIHVALCQLELARAYLLTGRPLESAETGEEALATLASDPELAEPLADVRGVLIDAYRALGELDSALTKVREVLASAPPDAHPAWLAMVRQDEGSLLEQLDRDEAAVEAFLTAASYYETAEQRVEQVQAIRLAAQSAGYTGDFDQAVELVNSAGRLLEALPSADEAVIFQTAGTQWDLAMLALRQGDSDTAVRHAAEAATHYERGGFESQHLNARLLIAEHGTTDEKQLAHLFASLPHGTEQWYRAGWLLVDRLRLQGRDHDAATLEARLSE
jgi:tetratricopeptide (TPR) repeat protein